MADRCTAHQDVTVEVMRASGDRPWRMRRALAGATTGAVVGAAGRAAVTLDHLHLAGGDAVLAAAIAAVLGAAIGAAAGVTGRPLVGIALGAGLTLVMYLAILPIEALFQLLGAGTIPPIIEVLAVGAVSGGLGGFVGRRAAAPEPQP